VGRKALYHYGKANTEHPFSGIISSRAANFGPSAGLLSGNPRGQAGKDSCLSASSSTVEPVI
jgi:hypothetical protein